MASVLKMIGNSKFFKEVAAPNLFPHYPWGRHFLMLAPLLVILFAVGHMHGFWGESVRLHYLARRIDYPLLSHALEVFTDHSSHLVFAFYTLILIFAVKNKDKAAWAFILRLVIGIVLFTVITNLLKQSFGMPRPGILAEPDAFAFLHEYTSFPSGHTFLVVAIAIPLAMWLKNSLMTVFLALLITSVGFSRIWLGMHHPVDILGGMIVGSIAARFIACSKEYLTVVLGQLPGRP